MIYREATLEDTEKIAMLHARSWQEHYRGILRNEFLDNQVMQDRLHTWTSRLQKPADNQYILVAEEGDELCGFACVFANHDAQWGALLDNLHVRSAYKGYGIGSTLLRSAARWAYSRNPHTYFHLFVYQANTPARKFYEGLGAVNHETVSVENPGGGFSPVCRYVWTDVKGLIQEKA